MTTPTATGDAAAGDPSSAPLRALDLAEPRIEVQTLPDGGRILRSSEPLRGHPTSLGERLVHWAQAAGDRVLVAERSGPHQPWRTVSYAEALAAARSIGQALLDRELGPGRPLAVLSGNSVDHLLVTLGAMLVGVPVAPVSVPYSLLSDDHERLRSVLETVQPGLVMCEQGPAFAEALRVLPDPDTEVLVGATPIDGRRCTPVADLRSTTPTAAVDAATAAVTPETVAKVLFTSGSTGVPKGVLTTQRMLTSNQQALSQIWPFAQATPPILVDWLPWSHTFGGNHNVGFVLWHGGSLYVDAGRPTPDLIERTVENLRDVPPTVAFNVPAGWAALVGHIEADPSFAARFFSRLQLNFNAGAALPQDVRDRLDAVSVATTGERVPITGSWGSTETAPLATSAHYPFDDARTIGVPVPGVEVKMVPSGPKEELRVRGPNVFPGYLEAGGALRTRGRTPDVFDEDGFYRIGDAGRLVDPEDPSRGLRFDGRLAEDFKLMSGTWVHTGGVRVAAVEAASPVVADAVVTGHDRAYIGLLVWLNEGGARKVAERPDAERGELATDPGVRAFLRDALAAHNERTRGSSARVARVVVLATPPDIDAGETTDKGYINQSTTLSTRADEVERLYADPPDDGVLVVTT